MRFHREGERGLSGKDSGHRLVRHQKLTSLELTVDLATLEGDMGLPGCGTPRVDSLDMKDLRMSEALPSSSFTEAKNQSCCEKIRDENPDSEKHV